MKIRSVLELSDTVDEETAWRKQELSVLLMQVRSADGLSQKVLLRCAVALLYAHWEGWVKNTTQMYLSFVNSQKLNYNDLSLAFLAGALKTKLSELGDAKTMHVQKQFAALVTQDLDSRAQLSLDLVRTDSNLSSSVILEIASRIDIERSFLETKASMIDHQLVNTRNSVAHGEYLAVDVADYVDLHHAVLGMLQEFTNRLLNAAAQGHYLGSNEAAS